MNEFAQNSSSMPTYHKKFDKIYDQLKGNDAAQYKAFINRY